MKTILAKVNDPMVSGGKIVHVFTPGSLTGTCAGTGVELTYERDSLYPVTAVAVDMEAARLAGWFAKAVKKVPTTVEEVAAAEAELQEEDIVLPSALQKPPTGPPKPKTCPKCGGPRRGRGYTHASNCENKSKVE